MSDERKAANYVHLSGRLGGCATDAHATAITDAADAGRVTCPICLSAVRVIPPGEHGEQP